MIGQARVPLEAVQLCADNAARLIEDSQGASEPTRAALLEVAMEEVSKGWILMTHLTDVGAPVIDSERLSNEMYGRPDAFVPDSEFGRSITQFVEGVVTVAPSVGDAFGGPKVHRKRLEFLGHIFGWIRNLIETAGESGESDRLFHFFYGKAMRPGLSHSEAKSELLETLRTLDETQLSNLGRLKEEGLYVNRTPGGGFVSPTSLPYPDLDDLEDVTVLPLELLRLNIRSLLRLSGQRSY